MRVRRLTTVAVSAALVVAVPAVALAASLDEAVCEGPLGGSWDADSSTCLVVDVSSDVGFALPEGLTVPLGVTLEGGDINTSSDFTVVNFGTIDVDLWEDATLDNYGTFIAVEGWNGLVINHCGASYTVTGLDDNLVIDRECSIVVAITGEPGSGVAPLTVDWTITMTNDGDEDLDAAQVTLSTDGGSTAFATLTAPAGDAGDLGVLDHEETWSWTVRTTESATVTVTATGTGTAPSGWQVTHPGDSEARVAATVTVTPTAATSTTSTTSAAASSTTSTAVAPSTTSSTVSSATLPFTGPQDATGAGVAGLVFFLAGAALLVTGVRARTDPTA